MKLYYFSEMPHHEFPDEEGLKHPSLRLELPNRFFDRSIAAASATSTSTRPPTRPASTGS
jgi:hypothetical protein